MPELPAFLASAASTSDLQSALLAACGYTPDRHVASARLVWISVNGVPCPQDYNDKIKRAWDSITIMRDFNLVAEQLPPLSIRLDFWQCRINIVATGYMLYLSLREASASIMRQSAVGLWLGIELCQPHPCPCGAMVDDSGLHGLSCKMSAGRSLRHFQINDLIFRALKRADIPSIKEPNGLVRGDGKKNGWPYNSSVEGWESIIMGRHPDGSR